MWTRPQGYHSWMDGWFDAWYKRVESHDSLPQYSRYCLADGNNVNGSVHCSPSLIVKFVFHMHLVLRISFDFSIFLKITKNDVFEIDSWAILTLFQAYPAQISIFYTKTNKTNLNPLAQRWKHFGKYKLFVPHRIIRILLNAGFTLKRRNGKRIMNG